MGDNRVFAGIDEAGRGPLAGPVTAACVVLPDGYESSSITDSKKLTASRRERLFPEICEVARAFSVVSVGPRRIDRHNILQATLMAMSFAANRVFRQLSLQGVEAGSFHLLIDGNRPIDTHFSQETIIKGDSKVLSIAAASILAKVTRDNLMKVLHQRHPEYGFIDHKGYPTAFHVAQIKEFGPTKVHRLTFAGVREHVSGTSTKSSGSTRRGGGGKVSAAERLSIDPAQLAFEVRRG